MRWLKKLFGVGRDNDLSAGHPETLPPAQFESAPLVAFQPHNEIERLLIEAATNVDARMAFQQALVEAELCAATPDAPEIAEERTVGEGEHISLLNVQGPDGTPVTAIFTAQERIVEVFGMGVGFVAIRGEELLSMVASQGAWLNPGFPYSVYWTPDQLSVILGKPKRRTVLKDTQILLSAPADPPTALIAGLREALANDSRIVEAWFALANWPDEDIGSWYLDVRTNLEADAVQNLLASTLKNADYAGRPLDMVVNKPDGHAGIGIRIVPLHTH